MAAFPRKLPAKATTHAKWGSGLGFCVCLGFVEKFSLPNGNRMLSLQFTGFFIAYKRNYFKL